MPRRLSLPRRGERRWQRPLILSRLGPGIVTGVADDDPSAIVTFTVSGAAFGYRLLWVALITLPMGIVIQTMCARLGIVSGSGLTTVLARRWGRRAVAPLVLFFAISCVISIGADLGAIAAVIELLTHARAALVVVPVAAAIFVLQVAVPYKQSARVLKYLTLVILAYVLAAIFAHPNFANALESTVTPHLSWDTKVIATIVAVVGALLSPYIYFWQTSEEVEERAATPESRRLTTRERLIAVQADVGVGMVAANLIYYFVVLASAAALFENGRVDVTTVRDAADALRPLAGDGAALLFSIGIIGSGLLAIPVLATSAAYAITELAGWSEGLSRSFGQAKAFYFVLGGAMVVGVAENLVGMPPIQALFAAAVINGLLTPVALVLIMGAVTDRRITGDDRPSRPAIVLGWSTTTLAGLAVAGLGISLL